MIYGMTQRERNEQLTKRNNIYFITLTYTMYWY
jgi:hypothetical protein